MTYSIVARDVETGQLGVAVQSHFFNVGRIVPWAEAGVGAVATQSFADPSYGPLGLALMRDGATAPEALAELVGCDADRDVRQVAMVDRLGNAAVHTGRRCVEAAGSTHGPGLTTQANMMVRSTVWDAMRTAFESATGPLSARLLAALDSAEAEGGDIRGRQSAAILVVGAEPTDRPWESNLLDLHVEDHPDPLVELRRLVEYARAYDEIGSALFTSGTVTGAGAPAGDVAERALAGLADADSVLVDNPEAAVWRCVLLARMGRVEEARATVVALGREEPQVIEFARRLVPAGFVPEGAEIA